MVGRGVPFSSAFDLPLWQIESEKQMKIMRLALAALFAVLAFSAMTASSASAFHPLFLTASGSELLFSGTGGLSVLRAEKLGNVGEVDCKESLVHGFALNGSTLAHKVFILFHTCLLTIPATKEHKNCLDVTTKLMKAELGLLSTTKTVLLLLAPESGTEFTKIECEGNKTTVGGAIIGEIPATSAGGTGQYNKDLAEIEIVFASVNKNQFQKYTSIELLGSLMTGIKLIVTEFLGGEASDEGSAILKGDGLIGVSTK